MNMGNNKATRVYVIDTETTGLDRDEDEILQLSIVDESGCTVYNSLFRPERHTSWEEAEKINHITPEIVANAPTFKEMLPIINEIFSFCGTVIGYNTGFDLAFLEKAGVEFREDTKVIDVQAMFMPIAGEWDWQQNKYKWQSLVKCAEYCGYKWRGSAHDSLADALATLHCFNSLVVRNATTVELPTPEEAAAHMRDLALDTDQEGRHCHMDGYLLSILEAMGYGEAVEIFDNSPKWYA